MNSLYESGYLQYLLILNLLTLVFILKSYGKEFSRKELLRKAFKYLLFFFVFHILDTLFIANTMRLKHDHFYNRVDYTTPIERDYLKFKENLHFGYCNIRMGLLSNLSCRPFYLFKHYKRSMEFESPKDFNKKTNRQDSKSRMESHFIRKDEKINECIRKKKYLSQPCIDANGFQFSRDPKRGKEIIRLLLTDLHPKLASMSCQEMYMFSIGYELFRYNLNEILVLDQFGGTNKNQWIRDIVLGSCFVGGCEEICSNLYRYYNESSIEKISQNIILVTLFLDEYPLNRENTYHKSRTKDKLKTLRSQAEIVKFEDFYRLVKKHYPKKLINLGIDKRNDKKLWLRVFHTN